jgi:hypothetical protein
MRRGAARLPCGAWLFCRNLEREILQAEFCRWNFAERFLVLAGARPWQEDCVEELNGRMIACQILVTGLIARVANDTKDPLTFLTDFRDEILAVVRQVRIAGALDTDRVRSVAVQTVDELFSLMKPPSTGE